MKILSFLWIYNLLRWIKVLFPKNRNIPSAEWICNLTWVYKQEPEGLSQKAKGISNLTEMFMQKPEGLSQEAEGIRKLTEMFMQEPEGLSQEAKGLSI